jgi:hypothetical protein
MSLRAHRAAIAYYTGRRCIVRDCHVVPPRNDMVLRKLYKPSLYSIEMATLSLAKTGWVEIKKPRHNRGSDKIIKSF